MNVSVVQISIGFVAAAVVVGVAYRYQLLNASGAAAALAVGGLVFGLGGVAYTVPLLVFFVTSSVLSRVGAARKSRDSGEAIKSGPRDAWQVLANGGIPTLIVCLSSILPPGATPSSRDWFLLYLGALAAANADTWSTEIGMLSKGWPFHVTAFRRVPPGTSGAVSWLGSIAALAGAAVISGAGWLAWPSASELFLWRMDAAEGLAITWGGFVASLSDSVLGATIQARYICRSCGREVEKTTHCGAPSYAAGGLPFVTNDVVNLAMCIFAVGATWYLLTVFAWPVR